MAKRRVRHHEQQETSIQRLSRRAVLLSAGASTLTPVGVFNKARGLEAGPTSPQQSFRNDPDHTHVVWRRIHEGKGKIGYKLFFDSDRPSQPAFLLLYDIPPGASEGVHTHNPGDAEQGSFDEFYYILAGSGEMQIAGKSVPVKPGDHIFTPNGVPHGIENTSIEENLKVYLVAVKRD